MFHAVPDGVKGRPGIISDFSTAKRGDLSNPYATNNGDMVCLDAFGWDDDENTNKCVALMRCGHFKDVSKADLTHSRIVEVITLFLTVVTPNRHYRRQNPLVNVHSELKSLVMGIFLC